MSVRKYWPAVAIVLLALAASGLGVVNDFTYDDRFVIFHNPFVHQLGSAWRVFGNAYWPKTWTGDGYRPLTILAFIIEWAIDNGSPVPFHVANILMYAATSLLVYRLALLLLPEAVALIVAALFAVHPVHVEAVANVVGQSELMVALAVLGATILYISDRRNGPLRPRTAWLVALLFAIAMLSKEHGIVLPAMLVAAEATVIEDRAPWKDRMRQQRPFYLLLGLMAVAFVAARSVVLSDHSVAGFAAFTPFESLKISVASRILTAISVVPQWVRLLLWPAHLSSEYGPATLPIAQGVSIYQLPGLLLLVGIVTLGVVLRRRQPVISFGVAIVCVALLPSSNFVLPAGILLAERTLFLPSVGTVLAVGGLIAAIADMHLERQLDPRRALILGRAALALLLLAGAYRSATRTRVWRDNNTLFHQAVIDGPDEYRAHFMLGAMYFENGDPGTGERELRRALQLFPYDPSLSFSLAEKYRVGGFCRAAVPMYRWTLGLDPNYPTGRTQLAMCLATAGDLNGAKHWALEALRVGGDARALHRILGVIDSAKKADDLRDAARKSAASMSTSKVPVDMQKATQKNVLRGSIGLVKPL